MAYGSHGHRLKMRAIQILFQYEQWLKRQKIAYYDPSIIRLQLALIIDYHRAGFQFNQLEDRWFAV